jgi:methanogenic corrinoid protein MtbC1
MTNSTLAHERASLYALVKLMAMAGDTMASDMLPLLSHSSTVREDGTKILDNALSYANEEITSQWVKGEITTEDAMLANKALASILNS